MIFILIAITILLSLAIFYYYIMSIARNMVDIRRRERLYTVDILEDNNIGETRVGTTDTPDDNVVRDAARLDVLDDNNAPEVIRRTVLNNEEQRLREDREATI